MVGLAFYIAILGLLTVLTIRKPHIALVGILCMFGLEQLGQVYLPFLRTNATFTNIYILMVLVIAVVLSYRLAYFQLSLNRHQMKVRLFSIALYLFALTTLLWAPANSWDYWSASWPYLVAHIVLAPLLIGRLDHLEEVQRTFIWIGGSLVLFLATVPDWSVRSLSIAGTEEDLGLPLATAQMSGYLLIAAILHFRKNAFSVGLLTIVAVGALMVSIKTGSRGQLIFSILSIILVTPFVWTRFSLTNALQLVVTILAILALAVYIFEQTDAYSDRWQTGEIAADLTNRLGMAKVILTEWIDSPLAIILGLGNSASFSEELLGVYPHVVPLEILGEEGTIGFILFSSIVILSIRQMKRLNSVANLSKDLKRVYATSFGCLIYTLLLSLKQGSLLNSSVIFLFAVITEKYYHLIKFELDSRQHHPVSKADGSVRLPTKEYAAQERMP